MKRLTKSEVCKLLDDAATLAGLEANGHEGYFSRRDKKAGRRRVETPWKVTKPDCRDGYIDCVWLKDGRIVAAFEVEGLNVVPGSVQKNRDTLTSVQASSAVVRAMVLFQEDEDKERRLKWNRWASHSVAPETIALGYLAIARGMADITGWPRSVHVHLDAELVKEDAFEPNDLLRAWGRLAADAALAPVQE